MQGSCYWEQRQQEVGGSWSTAQKPRVGEGNQSSGGAKSKRKGVSRGAGGAAGKVTHPEQLLQCFNHPSGLARLQHCCHGWRGAELPSCPCAIPSQQELQTLQINPVLIHPELSFPWVLRSALPVPMNVSLWEPQQDRHKCCYCPCCAHQACVA